MTDCWNRIGVRGDRSCPELERHVHCHHCPVYALAAMKLLDRDQPVEYLEASTSHFAKPQAAVERDMQSVFVFRLGAEWLALPTAAVNEVVNGRPIRSLPHRRTKAVLGIANVRGELLVCVALGRVLGLDASAPSSQKAQPDGLARLLVIRRDEIRTACPVDEVYGVLRVHPRELQEVPATVARARSSFSKAVLPWQGHSVGLLNEQALFSAMQRSLA